MTIKEYRKHTGKSAAELAREWEITERCYYNYEQRGVRRLHNAMRIEKATKGRIKVKDMIG